MSKKSDISAKTKILAVIGDPIGHSMSPVMHNAALEDLDLDYVYEAFHVKAEKLESAVEGFRALEIQGVNVTIPHKVKIMQYLDEIEKTAKKLGAINTIKNENGYLKAKNTDGEGALKAIKDEGFEPKGKTAVMFGAGGAARAVAFYLLTEINEFYIVNREEDFNLADQLKQNLSQYYDKPISTIKLENEEKVRKTLNNSDILINTTPVGMHPHSDNTPVKKEWLHSSLFVFDVVYNPMETKLLREAKEVGCKTQSGINMFVNQGWLAFKWWTGKEPNADLMKKIVIEQLGLE